MKRLVCLGLVFCLVFASASALAYGYTYGSSISEDYKAGLFVYAKELVTAHLKSPLTAKFPNYSECSYQKGEDGVYMVVGYVDSQNSFGAMIRETWGCMIQEVGTKWQVIMVQIGDNIYFD